MPGQPHRRLRIKSGRRFIKQQQRRVGQQRARDRRALAHAARKGPYQRILALAKSDFAQQFVHALLADPSLLLFDEPATGLDPEATVWLTGHLAKLRDSGCTILMSLHGESEVARLATRAVRLDAGSVVADTRSGATFQSVFSFAGG